MILNMVRTEQAAWGGDFDRHWHRVCNRRPGLARVMNGAGEAGCLEGLEPTAHGEYMKAVQGDAQAYKAANPGTQKFFDKMTALAVGFPKLGFEGRWEKMKDSCPVLFWQFVLTVATDSSLEK